MLSTNVLAAEQVVISPVRQLAQKFKDNLSGQDEGSMKILLVNQYKKFRFLSSDDKWATPELEKVSTTLVPDKFNLDTIYAFMIG